MQSSPGTGMSHLTRPGEILFAPYLLSCDLKLRIFYIHCQAITVYAERDPAAINWAAAGAKYVLLQLAYLGS